MRCTGQVSKVGAIHIQFGDIANDRQFRFKLVNNTFSSITRLIDTSSQPDENPTANNLRDEEDTCVCYKHVDNCSLDSTSNFGVPLPRWSFLFSLS